MVNVSVNNDLTVYGTEERIAVAVAAARITV